MCFGLFVSAFIRLVLQVIRQKCKRRNDVCVCLYWGPNPRAIRSRCRELFFVFQGMGCRYEEALGAVSGTYCFIHGPCQRCLPSPATWAGGSAVGLSRCWGPAAHPTAGIFHWVLQESETQCPWLQHCPVWVLGLPLHSQVPTGELGSAHRSERDFLRAVPFMSVMIGSI